MEEEYLKKIEKHLGKIVEIAQFFLVISIIVILYRIVRVFI